MTRAEIEAKEYDDFTKFYKFNLNINGRDIYQDQSSKIKFEIIKKYKKKKKYFK
jgi:hypothetical protein